MTRGFDISADGKVYYGGRRLVDVTERSAAALYVELGRWLTWKLQERARKKRKRRKTPVTSNCPECAAGKEHAW